MHILRARPPYGSTRVTTTAAVRRLAYSFVVTLIAATSAIADPLDSRLNGLIGAARLGNSRIGVCIIDADSERRLASTNLDSAFMPASNMKLLTSGSALSILGPDFKFRTELVYQPEAHRLIIRGSGDPALADPELLKEMKFSVDDLLKAWVDAANKASGGTINELIIDDRIFDREFVHATWPPSQLNRWYCAEVAGLNFHTNVLNVFARPTKAGQPPIIGLEPNAPWIQLQNRARTVAKGEQTAWVARQPESNDMVLNGDVRYANDPVRVALHNNPGFVAQLLATRLRTAGVKVGMVRVVEPDERLADGDSIYSVVTSLETTLERCNQDSHNLYAECMIKRMGHEITGAPGSWRNGATVVRMAINQRLGEGEGRDVIVADGSGMSRENRVSPSLLARWLISFHKDSRLGPAFIESLPLGGLEGTLDSRFRDRKPKNEVRAKSGYITGVSALSGYVTHVASGRRVAFSIIINDKPNNVATSALKQFEERVVLMIDDWLTNSVASEMQQAKPENRMGG